MVGPLVCAAIYLRTPGGPDATDKCMELRRGQCDEIATARGWAVIETYIDSTPSSEDQAPGWPSYDRMVADYSAGRFAAIICWDLESFLGQSGRLASWTDAAQGRDLKIVAVKDRTALTIEGSGVDAGVADPEPQRRPEYRALGRTHGTDGTPPFGYSMLGEVVEAEAMVVRELFRLCALRAGPSIASVAAALPTVVSKHAPLAQGEPDPSHSSVSRHDRPGDVSRSETVPAPDPERWSLSAILGMLRDPRYAGLSAYPDVPPTHAPVERAGTRSGAADEESLLARESWEPLVSMTTWSAVQRRLDSQPRTRAPHVTTSHQYLGSGVYLCGLCSEPVTVHSGRYRCSDQPARGAGHFTRLAEPIDEHVLRLVRLELGRSDLSRALVPANMPRLTLIPAEIAEHRGKIERVQRDYDAGYLQRSDLRRTYLREEPLIADLDREWDQAIKASGLKFLVDSADPVAAFDESGLSMKRLVVASLVEVRILRQPQGRRGFDPETVQVAPRVRRPRSV